MLGISEFVFGDKIFCEGRDCFCFSREISLFFSFVSTKVSHNVCCIYLFVIYTSNWRFVSVLLFIYSEFSGATASSGRRRQLSRFLAKHFERRKKEENITNLEKISIFEFKENGKMKKQKFKDWFEISRLDYEGKIHEFEGTRPTAISRVLSETKCWKLKN